MQEYMFWYLDLSGRDNSYFMSADDARQILFDGLVDLDMTEDEACDMVDEINSFIEERIEGSELVQDGSFKIICVAKKSLRRMKGGK